MNQNREPRSNCCVDGRRSSTFLRQFHQLEPDLAHARVDKADSPGDAIGYINFAAFLIRTPVINAYQFKFPVTRVYDPHQGAERQMGVRGGKRLAVEDLAVSRLAAIEAGSVPACVTYPGFDRLRFS